MRKQGMAEVFVYLIKSINNNWNYVGFTGDLNSRLREHNSGSVKSTKAYKPFRLVFAQIVENRLKARSLEKFLKVRFNKEALLNLF